MMPEGTPSAPLPDHLAMMPELQRAEHIHAVERLTEIAEDHGLGRGASDDLGEAAASPSGLSQSSLASCKHHIAIASDRATIRPMFTSRVHYGAPKARGHRSFILAKQEWR